MTLRGRGLLGALAVAVLGAIGLATSDVRAEARDPVAPAPRRDAPSAERWMASGDRFYETRRYRKAIDAWERAYAADPQRFPLALFNIAQAWEKLGETQRALMHYVLFRGKVTDATMRAETDKIIDRLRKLRATRDAAVAAAAAEAEAAAEKEFGATPEGLGGEEGAARAAERKADPAPKKSARPTKTK